MQEKNIITQTKKEFQSMLSTFSHEIRNPLALITSEMQALLTTTFISSERVILLLFQAAVFTGQLIMEKECTKELL